MRPVTINFGMVMRAWYDILEMDVSRRIDMENVLESSDRIRDLIQRERDFGIPSDRILLAGFSQGGAVALHTGLHYPEPLAGILALSTYLPTAATLAEDAAAANRRTPIMMGHGRFDALIPMHLGIATRKVLTGLNYPVTWHAYPIQHEVCPEELQDVDRWLLEILG
jgi:phospholipase/carboxylesterase